MPAMATTMTATDSGWSFPRAGAAASEAGVARAEGEGVTNSFIIIIVKADIWFCA